MGFFERRLRLKQHNNPDILYQDATLTLAKWENARDPAIELLAAFLQHAPSEQSIAQDIVALREPIEAEYYETVDEVARFAPYRLAMDERNARLRATDILLGDLKALADHYHKAIVEPFISFKRRDIPENPCWDSDPPTMVWVEPTKRKGMRGEASRTCCVTGRLDLDITNLNAAEQADIMSKGSYVPGGLDCLQVAHIFPYAFNKFDVENYVAVKRAKIIWTAFRDFSGYDLDDLVGPGINQERNLFMLSPVAHKLFDRLDLWFSPIQDPVMSHKIEIDSRHGRMLSTLGKVDLDSRVDSRLLAIHRSLCFIYRATKDYRDEGFQLSSDEDDDTWV